MKWGSLSTLGKVTAVALLGMAIDHMATQLAIEDKLMVYDVLFELVLLGFATLATTGKWRATGVAALVGGLFSALTIALMSRLPETAEAGVAGIWAFVVLGGIVLVAGTAATMNNFRMARVMTSGPKVRST